MVIQFYIPWWDVTKAIGVTDSTSTAIDGIDDEVMTLHT